MSDCALWINSNVSLKKKKTQRKPSQLNQTEKSVIKLSKSPNPQVTKTLARTASEICNCDYILNFVILKPLLSLM